MLRHHRVLSIYRQKFTSESKWKVFIKNLPLFFNNYNLMKKTFLVSVTVSILSIFGIYAFSIFNPQLINSGLTAEILIAKAQAVEEKKAEEGRYYYQKVKRLEWAKGSTTPREQIEESWSDTQTSDYLNLTRNAQTNKILHASISKNDILYYYSSDGTLRSESKNRTSTNPAIVTNTLANELKNLMVGKENVLPKDHLLWGDNIKVEYLGSSIRNNLKVEGLVLKHKNEIIETKFFFDAKTFELIEIESIDKQLNKTIDFTQILVTNYSNDPPTIEVGVTKLSLENKE